MSSPSEPEEIVSISIERSFLPSRITDPLPNWRSIWDRAADSALLLSMEEPSTIRRAGADIGQTPYGGDSLGGQMVNENGRQLETMYLICSQFAICSFWSSVWYLPVSRLSGPACNAQRRRKSEPFREAA